MAAVVLDAMVSVGNLFNIGLWSVARTDNSLARRERQAHAV